MSAPEILARVQCCDREAPFVIEVKLDPLSDSIDVALIDVECPGGCGREWELLVVRGPHPIADITHAATNEMLAAAVTAERRVRALQRRLRRKHR